VIVEALRARLVFAKIAATEESTFPLDQAALAIGLEEYPGLDLDEYLKRLNILAARTEALAGQDRSTYNVLECLNEALFVQEGLRGNLDDYYDPENSYLNKVLDRKLGIPISLSVIYMEVARRIGFPILGVGFPGHFVVKHVEKESEIFVDPFNQGRILTMKDCQELMDNLYGGSVTVHPTFLQAMDKKAIISRMLFNLKGIYNEKQEYYKAHTSLFSKALADLEYYLANAPSPDDAAQVEGHIKTLRSIVGASN